MRTPTPAPGDGISRTWESLSRTERDHVSRLIVDALGIAAAGACAPGVTAMVDALGHSGGGDVTPIWTDVLTNAPTAGMILSILIHGWDFDDTHDEAVVHASSIVISSAVAALALDERCDGRRFLDAVVTGLHMLPALARRAGPRSGVIRTAGLGSIAAAITTATILGLDGRAIHSAAGLALTGALSPTTRQSVVDGSLAKRLQPGLSVQTGMTAALLARAGVEGPQGWWHGEFGILPGDHDGLALMGAGAFEGTGLALKPYPACRYTHAALEAARAALIARPELRSAPSVTVRLPAGEAYALVARPFRRRGAPVIDAQFSVAWQVGALLTTGTYDLRTLAGPDLEDPRIARAAERVSVVQDLPLSSVMSGAEVVFDSAPGEVSAWKSAMPGSPALPLDWDAVSMKVDACLEVAGVQTTAAELRALTVELPTLDAAGVRGRFAALRASR